MTAEVKPVWKDDGTYCPYWQKKRTKVCHTCAFYGWIKMQNPQTGEEVQQWDCCVAQQSMLAINMARENSQMTSSIDKMATVMAVGLQVIADTTAASSALPPPENIVEQSNALIDYSRK